MVTLLSSIELIKAFVNAEHLSGLELWLMIKPNTSLSRNSVNRATRDLARAGLVTVVNESSGGKCRLYRLTDQGKTVLRVLTAQS